jgi:4-amino-4-deoxy-L-arabinose transferase-like glycosyltransferase
LATETPVRKGELPRWESLVRSGSLEIPLVLAGLLLAAFVVRLVLAYRIATPWIMVDEFIYSELAKSFAEHGQFLIRDTASPFHNVLYPALISPAWLTDPIGRVYDVARAINVFLMVVTALPVYLWGRRLMSQGYALLAAVLVLLMPSLNYTGMLMTENAFFPAFVIACFAIALTLERPTVLRQLLVLVAIGVTVAVRPQALVVVLVYATALALKLGLDLRAPAGQRGWRYVGGELRRYWPTAVAGVVLVGGYVVYKAMQGVGLESGLGPYAGVVKVHYDLGYASGWVVDHFAELGLSVGLIPVSALIVLLGGAVRGWRTTEAERAFLAVAAPAFVLLVIEVGIYASRFSLRIEERNMFVIAPLFFLAFALWLARGLPRPIVLTVVAAVAPAALLLTLNLKSLLNIGVLSDTFALVPLLRLSGEVDGGVDTVRLLLLGGGLAAAVAFVLLPRRVAAVALPLAIGVFLVVSSYSVFRSIRDHSRATLALTSPTNPSWIDTRIGTHADAAYLYAPTADPYADAQVMWQTEFWNRSVGKVYALGFQDPASLPTNAATFDALRGRIVPTQGGGTVKDVRYAVAPTTVRLRGRLLAQEGRLALYEVNSPLRLATHLGGVYSDSWMGGFAALTHYTTPNRPGRLMVRVSREGWRGASPPGRVTISVGPLVLKDGQPAVGKPAASRTWTVRSGTAKSFILPTPASPYRLEVHIDPTFSPATFGGADPRQLGAQLQISSF